MIRLLSNPENPEIKRFFSRLMNGVMQVQNNHCAGMPSKNDESASLRTC